MDFTVQETHPFVCLRMCVTRGAAKARLSCPIQIECTMIRVSLTLQRPAFAYSYINLKNC